ncbi:sensor histidine kinase [Luteococcus peritonei]|uniref:histidine kinase n=1 Tax=Luteococcus peritonei TaxID=88874 RepID=A0ABW4RXT5_9ACTN
MSQAAAPHRPPGVSPTGWIVALLGAFYYLTPLAVARAREQMGTERIGLLVLGAVLSLVALVWLPRRPRGVVALLVVLWIVCPPAFGPALVVQERISRQPSRAPGAISAAVFLAAKLVGTFVASGGHPVDVSWVEFAISALGILLAMLVGWLQHSTQQERQQRQAATTARQEAWEARVEQARLAERERIAREMHDVVAHRISLIALHSGALAHRMREAEPESAELAGQIQANAKASLEELRAMLATLRGSQAAPEPPQPTLAGLSALLDQARGVGQQVELEVVRNLDEVGDRVSRHAFRIVQEGLTNARRHAPGAPTRVRVVRHPRELELVVVNPLADLAPPDHSGSGLGLVGVAERVEQLGGELEHGIRGAEFELRARLPLAAGPAEGAS